MFGRPKYKCPVCKETGRAIKRRPHYEDQLRCEACGHTGKIEEFEQKK